MAPVQWPKKAARTFCCNLILNTGMSPNPTRSPMLKQDTGIWGRILIKIGESSVIKVKLFIPEA